MVAYRTVCTAQAGASLAGGFVLLILPAPLLGFFTLPTDPSTQLVARILGAVLFALGATLLGVRDVADRDQRTRVIAGNAACDLSVTILLLSATVAGALGPTAWLLTALFAANAGSWMLAYRNR